MTEKNFDHVKNKWEIASSKKMISYSFGFILSLYLLSSYNSLVFYFYEVEVGLEVGLVSLAVIIFSIWIMISSPILGYLTDKPFKWSKRLGFRAPWVIIAAIPALIFFILLFSPPNVDAKANPWLVFWYLLIMSCLFGSCVIIYREHFEGGFANQFREDFERRRASSMNFIFPAPILFFLSIIPLFIIVYGDKKSFLITAIVSMGILGICLIALIPGIRESPEVKNRYLQGYKDESRISFFGMMNHAFRKKNFMVSLIATTFVAIATTLNMVSGIYFFKDVLGLPLVLSIFPTFVYFITVIIALPFWVSFARKHGNVNTYILGLFLVGACYIPVMWITTLAEAIIFSALRGFAGSCTIVMILPIISDVYDEVTLSCGKHQEATLLGIRTIFMRSSIIIASLIIALVHIFTGYNQDPNATQTALAIWGVRLHRGLIPMIFCFAACAIMLIGFDLKGEKQRILKVNLRDRGL